VLSGGPLVVTALRGLVPNASSDGPYVPQGVDTKGWHPIEVQLKNKKGKVAARRGYLR